MMKRKATPFPSSSVCSMVRNLDAPPLPPPETYRSSAPSSASAYSYSSADEDIVLPDNHQFSLFLSNDEAVHTLELNRPDGIVSWKRLSPGLIELTIQSGREKGYGLRTWPFRIGGVGLIYDGFTAPVAVRCGVPIAHSHIDDAGFVDVTFWTDDLHPDNSFNSSNLLRLGVRLIDFLSSFEDNGEGRKEGEESGERVQREESEEREGGLLKREERDQRWIESEAHCFDKVSIINKYKSLALCPALVDVKGHLRSEWLAPGLGFMLGSPLTCDSGLTPGTVADWCRSVEQISPGVFCFDLFTSEFCDLLVREFDCFESTSLPRRRPNTMNKFGLILNEIGLEPIMSDLLTRVIAPLSGALYPNESVAKGLDHHHTFIVVYSPTGDKGLDMHHDASEVTLNVCLGRDFSEGGLVFCGQAGRPDHRRVRHVYSHSKGRAIIHLGRQRHGADNIAGGERVNMIMWARSSAFRCAAVNGSVSPDGFPRLPEDGPPDLVCLSHSNDGDYAQQVKRIAEDSRGERGS